jgi:hypothetical protein
MVALERELGSWVSATVDFLLAVLGFTLASYPLVSLGNAVLGSPHSAATVNLVTGVLAFGGAYPVVAGDWSLGQLGEYVFVLFASALGWGLIGMLLILASGLTFSGRNQLPQAVLWATASLTAYIVVYRTQLSIIS